MLRMRGSAIVAGLVLSTVALEAQPRFQTGLVLGTSIATLANLPYDPAIPSANTTASYRAGFQGGIFAQIPMTARFSLQPEVHYVQKGAYFEGGLIDPGAGSVSNVSLRLGYVDVPVLARVDVGRRTGLHPFVVAGPSLALRMQCTSSLTANKLTLKSECDENGESQDPFRKSDINGIVGAGLATNLAGHAVTVQARMSQSLRSVGNDKVQSEAAFAPKNRAISIVFSFTQ